jgi:uncharacterized membrane protein YbaN (DUF454 family)
VAAMKKILNLIFLLIGFLAVGLGTLGILLPLLPTTPLYLLACFCFAKGSPRFHKWFINTKLYKKYLENFVRTRAMTLRAKLSICLPVSFIMIISMIAVSSWMMRTVIICLLLFIWWYFTFRIKTTSI